MSVIFLLGEVPKMGVKVTELYPRAFWCTRKVLTLSGVYLSPYTQDDRIQHEGSSKYASNWRDNEEVTYENTRAKQRPRHI